MWNEPYVALSDNVRAASLFSFNNEGCSLITLIRILCSSKHNSLYSTFTQEILLLAVHALYSNSVMYKYIVLNILYYTHTQLTKHTPLPVRGNAWVTPSHTQKHTLLRWPARETKTKKSWIRRKLCNYSAIFRMFCDGIVSTLRHRTARLSQVGNRRTEPLISKYIDYHHGLEVR
jgi:hypothetical protein